MRTILFVDDHHALRTVFAETLRSAGYEVLEAGTLPDAEYLIQRRSGPVDLLIVEAVLTSTNGRKVAERLRLVQPGMRVLFISEEPASSLSGEGLLYEGAAFLHKPFSVEELLRKLQQVAQPAKLQKTAHTRKAG